MIDMRIASAPRIVDCSIEFTARIFSATWKVAARARDGSAGDGPLAGSPPAAMLADMSVEFSPPPPAPSVLDVREATVRFGRFTAVDHVSVRGRPRRDLRPARAQRLGQDDADPRPVRPVAAGRGLGAGAGPRREPRGRGDPGPDRLHVAEVLALRGPDGPREHGLLRRHLRPAPGRGLRAEGRADRPGRPRALPRPLGRPALGRLEAAAGPGLCPAAPARPRLPRRADRRHRPGGPPRPLGPALPARRRGRHALRHDALHGRGRALRPGRLPAQRPACWPWARPTS